MGMSKLLRQIVFLVLMGVLVAVSGGCGGGSDSKYPVVNADGAILPKDPTNWTAAEKSAWINQGTLLDVYKRQYFSSAGPSAPGSAGEASPKPPSGATRGFPPRA